MKLFCQDDESSTHDGTGKAQFVCVLLFLASEVALGFRMYGTKAPAAETLRWPFLLLVGLPFLLGVILVTAVSLRRSRASIDLVIPFLDDRGRSSNAMWQQIAQAVRENWAYERGRMRRGLDRVRLSALLFGTVPAVLLALCALLASWSPRPAFEQDKLRLFALAVGTSVLATYMLHFAALMVRISNSDINSRMFAWSLRSTVLVSFASSGLMLSFGIGDTHVVTTWAGAALLGVLIAALGDRAIPLLIDKASAVFGVKLPARDDSFSLRTLEGITDDDVDRFAEDGVLSVHDLAFASTARLFFSTTQSLPRICDWQDQALLRVYMGPVRMKALADTMALRGAIDLQGMAQIALQDLFPSEEEAPPPDDGAAATAPALSLPATGTLTPPPASAIAASGGEAPLAPVATSHSTVGAMTPPTTTVFPETSDVTSPPTASPPPGVPPPASGKTPAPAAVPAGPSVTPPPDAAGTPAAASTPAASVPPAAAVPPPAAAASGPVKSAASGPTAAPAQVANGAMGLAKFKDDIRAALGKALGLEGAALTAALLTLRHDEVILRVRVHWQSTPKSEES